MKCDYFQMIELMFLFYTRLNFWNMKCYFFQMIDLMFLEKHEMRLFPNDWIDVFYITCVIPQWLLPTVLMTLFLSPFITPLLLQTLPAFVWPYVILRSGGSPYTRRPSFTLPDFFLRRLFADPYAFFLTSSRCFSRLPFLAPSLWLLLLLMYCRLDISPAFLS